MKNNKTYCKECGQYMNAVQVVVSGQLLCGKCIREKHKWAIGHNVKRSIRGKRY